MSLMTVEYVLRGSWFALEQAGRLLGAAAVIARAGDVTTAAGVALLGREEFGTARRLMELSQSETALAAGGVSAAELQLENHAAKQKAGNVSVVVSLRDPRLADLQREDPESFRKKIDQAVHATRKQAPDQRRELREKCLYLDHDKRRAIWSRPCERPTEEVRSELQQAIMDYYNFVTPLTQAIEDLGVRKSLSPGSAGLAAFAEQWKDRPVLPQVSLSELIHPE